MLTFKRGRENTSDICCCHKLLCVQSYSKVFWGYCWVCHNVNLQHTQFLCQFITVLHVNELMLNSYQFVHSLLYVFTWSFTPHWVLRLGVDLHGPFFLKIVHFCMNQIVWIHAKSNKINTKTDGFSYVIYFIAQF